MQLCNDSPRNVMYLVEADSNDEDNQSDKRRVHHAHIAKDLIQTYLMVDVQP